MNGWKYEAFSITDFFDLLKHKIPLEFPSTYNNNDTLAPFFLILLSIIKIEEDSLDNKI